MHSLLTLEKIRANLHTRFSEKARAYPDHYAAMIPEVPSSSTAAKTVEEIEGLTGASLPKSFIDCLYQWDLGRLEIAGIGFGRDGEFSRQVAKYNSPLPGLQWWEDRDQERRPLNLLMIGQGDLHVLLLDQSTGRIHAYATENGSASCTAVASDLNTLLRGLGSLYLYSYEPDANAEMLATELFAQMGGNVSYDFWRELAVNFAA